MSEIYRTFETLSVDENRVGYVLIDNGETLELQYTSLYSDDPDTVTFLEPTAMFNARSDWTQSLMDQYIYAITTGAVRVLGKYDADDRSLPQYRYGFANRLVTYGVKVYEPVCDDFREACATNNESQTKVITRLMEEYIKNTKHLSQ